jgi:lipopolysaccharide export system permease protein
VKILDRYLGRTFLHSWLSVNLVLTGLFSFLELARQLDDIGKGRYSMTDALLYVCLTLPGRMVEMAPPSALLGSIIALGLLKKNLELLSLWACGVSIQRVGFAFMKPAVLTILALLLGAQFIIPSLEQTAWTLRETAIAVSGTILPRGGFWTRDGKRFINLRTARSDGRQAVDIYEFNDKRRLADYTNALDTSIGADGKWTLRDVQHKTVTAQGSLESAMPQLVLSHLLTSKQAAVLSLPPQTLSLTELSSIITNLQKREQNAGRYRLTLWQKLSLPLMTAAMIMISLPFVGRWSRGGSLGWHIMVGAIIGVGFFYVNQILGYAGLILQVSPLWTTLLPALAVLGGGAFLTKKIV